MTHTGPAQLTLDVALHPGLLVNPATGQPRDEEAYLTGSLKISGALHCPSDINSGDELTVTVADADGNVIAGGKLIGKYPAFREIKDRGEIIGTERVNKVEIQ